MTFNPELIAKARRGEIAIRNDGNEQQRRDVLNEVWTGEEETINRVYNYKFYYKHPFADTFRADDETDTSPPTQ